VFGSRQRLRQRDKDFRLMTPGFVLEPPQKIKPNPQTLTHYPQSQSLPPTLLLKLLKNFFSLSSHNQIVHVQATDGVRPPGDGDFTPFSQDGGVM
jgi:hypothetical protein